MTPILSKRSKIAADIFTRDTYVCDRNVVRHVCYLIRDNRGRHTCFTPKSHKQKKNRKERKGMGGFVCLFVWIKGSIRNSEESVLRNFVRKLSRESIVFAYPAFLLVVTGPVLHMLSVVMGCG